MEAKKQDQRRGDRWLVRVVDLAERVVYYGAALFLLLTVGIVFFSAAVSLVDVRDLGSLEAALGVLDRVLLIFIFAELLRTVSTIVREQEIVAEPFLLIGLIAVVRRILTATASVEQYLGTPEFQSLLIELAVLTALVVALSFAIFFTRRTGRSAGDEGA